MKGKVYAEIIRETPLVDEDTLRDWAPKLHFRKGPSLWERVRERWLRWVNREGW